MCENREAARKGRLSFSGFRINRCAAFSALTERSATRGLQAVCRLQRPVARGSCNVASITSPEDLHSDRSFGAALRARIANPTRTTENEGQAANEQHPGFGGQSFARCSMRRANTIIFPERIRVAITGGAGRAPC
jgi:hypothetical protein